MLDSVKHNLLFRSFIFAARVGSEKQANRRVGSFGANPWHRIRLADGHKNYQDVVGAGNRKSKKGFGRFLRNTFSRSLSHLPNTPTSSPQSAFQASSLLGGLRTAETPVWQEAVTIFNVEFNTLSLRVFIVHPISYAPPEHKSAQLTPRGTLLHLPLWQQEDQKRTPAYGLFRNNQKGKL
ncbi:hypothetical protein B0J17DRAFT_628408 [Rhizoctonia solani]|nr:hypothetical protein B0J17DRAFT_628408 [Rhizoctonia solani]